MTEEEARVFRAVKVVRERQKDICTCEEELAASKRELAASLESLAAAMRAAGFKSETGPSRIYFPAAKLRVTLIDDLKVRIDDDETRVCL